MPTGRVGNHRDPITQMQTISKGKPSEESKAIKDAAKEATDKEIEALWERFDEITVREDGCIDDDFYIWEEGTDRNTIWHWFAEKHSKGVHWLIYEYVFD